MLFIYFNLDNNCFICNFGKRGTTDSSVWGGEFASIKLCNSKVYGNFVKRRPKVIAFNNKSSIAVFRSMGRLYISNTGSFYGKKVLAIITLLSLHIPV